MNSVKYLKIISRTIIAIYIFASSYAIITGSYHHIFTLVFTLLFLIVTERIYKQRKTKKSKGNYL